MTERDVRRPGFGGRLLLLCAIAWLSVASLAMASEYHGQITFGGLPVPGTTVTVTATQGSKKAVAITDAQGVYSFPDLADGTWTIDIEMTGFAPVKQEVTVAPNAPAGTFEMKLLSLDQIRAAAKPVKVEAAPVMAASAVGPESSGTAAASKSPAATKSATAKTNDAKAAVPEAPAAAPAPDPNAQQANDGFLINGSVNNAATSQFSLSQAFGNGRSGGRSLYNGGLSLILDNSALDAKPFSVTGLDSPRPDYNNIVAGVTFGGPLKIPHLMPRGPNFFISYQRTQRSTDTTQQALVPTAAEWGGNFSQQLSATGQAIYAPTTGLSPACLSAPGVAPGSAFAGNIVPAACISAVAENLMRLNFYPSPNVSGNAQYNYQVPLTNSTHQDAFRTQLNKQLGNKNNLNGNFNLQSTRSGNTSLFGFKDSTDSLGINTNANWYHRFTQRLSMNAGYTFSRSRTQVTPYFANRENVSAVAGISGNDQDSTYWGPPTLNFSQSGIYSLSDGTSSHNRSETNSFSYFVQWNRFRHNVQVGGDFRRQEFNYLTQSSPEGTLTFTGVATQASGGTGGSDFADFLLGLPDTSQIAFGNADKYLRQSVYDLYANDDFRVNPELSINAGVRWEYGAPITELKGRLVNLDVAPGFSSETPVLGSSPVGSLTGQSFPTSLIRPDKAGIAPIVGIAWRPISGSSLLVRAGYGIYHDTSVYQATALAMAQQAPLSTSLSVPNSAACRFNISSPFAVLPCSSTTPDTFGVDPNFRVGYAQSWQLSVQRDLPGSLQMVATYSGIKGTRGVQEFLPNTYPVGGTNPCASCPSGFLYRDSNGDSTREAGSIQLRRRLRSGFQANLSYTYSKSLDDDYSLGGQGPVTAGAISQGGSLSGQVAQNWLDPSTQRGLSTFDQRHVLAVQMQYTTGMGIGGRTLMSGWRGAAYKEWTLLTNISTGSGLPETPLDPVAVPGTGYSGIIRANYAGGPIHVSSPGLFLNPAAFTAPLAGQWGDARRDSITGPDQFALGASMARTFRLHDRYNLDTRIDATNALNHVTYSGWVTTVGSSLFGTPSSANGMRSMTVTVRLRF